MSNERVGGVSVRTCLVGQFVEKLIGLRPFAVLRFECLQLLQVSTTVMFQQI